MNLKTAIDLIRDSLPPRVLREIKPMLTSEENLTRLSAKGFSIGYQSDPENFRLILERRIRSAQSQSDQALQRYYKQELEFVKEVFTASTSRNLWHAYCVVDVRRLLIFKKRKCLMFLIDTARGKVLKHFDPHAAAVKYANMDGLPG